LPDATPYVGHAPQISIAIGSLLHGLVLPPPSHGVAMLPQELLRHDPLVKVVHLVVPFPQLPVAVADRARSAPVLLSAVAWPP
jgi:hypothetical protein